jgi:hypothetical protein
MRTELHARNIYSAVSMLRNVPVGNRTMCDDLAGS